MESFRAYRSLGPKFEVPRLCSFLAGPDRDYILFFYYNNNLHWT